jgi:calcineurin-like phosphoesterase family protein
MAIAGLYKIFDHWHQEGSVWIISDFHFDDEELAAGVPGRPTAEEFVKRINAKCGRKDTLICLGDVGNIDWVKQLRAKHKVLIMGNHDAGRTNYEGAFDEVYEGPLTIAEKLILSHEPVDVPWAFNIHGHDHTGRKTDKRHLNVCADVIGYTPVNMNQFMKSGALAHIETLHRDTIDAATQKKKKRGGKKINVRKPI